LIENSSADCPATALGECGGDTAEKDDPPHRRIILGSIHVGTLATNGWIARKLSPSFAPRRTPGGLLPINNVPGSWPAALIARLSSRLIPPITKFPLTSSDPKD
jgi:hypothetical protein